MQTATAPYGDLVTEAQSDMWWTAEDCAEYCEISLKTWHAYVARGQAPAEDHRYARTPLWKPETVRNWHAARPGRGRWGASRT